MASAASARPAAPRAPRAPRHALPIRAQRVLKHQPQQAHPNRRRQRLPRRRTKTPRCLQRHLPEHLDVQRGPVRHLRAVLPVRCLRRRLAEPLLDRPDHLVEVVPQHGRAVFPVDTALRRADRGRLLQRRALRAVPRLWGRRKARKQRRRRETKDELKVEASGRTRAPNQMQSLTPLRLQPVPDPKIGLNTLCGTRGAPPSHWVVPMARPPASRPWRSRKPTSARRGGRGGSGSTRWIPIQETLRRPGRRSKPTLTRCSPSTLRARSTPLHH